MIISLSPFNEHVLAHLMCTLSVNVQLVAHCIKIHTLHIQTTLNSMDNCNLYPTLISYI